MIVTPILSQRIPDSVIFTLNGFPVFFQKGRTPPDVGVEVDCMITKCFYSRFNSGALDYSRLRFMTASPLVDDGKPKPLLVNHDGFHYNSFDQELPVAFVSEDVYVNGTLVASKGDLITGTHDLAASPRSTVHPVPGRIYVRKRDGVIRAVGVEDLSSFSYFSGR